MSQREEAKSNKTEKTSSSQADQGALSTARVVPSIQKARCYVMPCIPLGTGPPCFAARVGSD